MSSKKYAIVTGNFDGIHCGHGALFKKLIEVAKERSLTPLVISFTPHTRKFIHKKVVPLLTSSDEKIKRLKEGYGLDLKLLEFNRELRNLSPEEYAKNILVGQIGAEYWLKGTNHHYGKEASSKKTTTCYDFLKGEVFELTKIHGEIVSSTAIREHLSRGEIIDANRKLGYEYSLEGEVIRGDQRGSKIGFPTANIKLNEPDKVIPKDGVYGGFVELKGQKLKAIANLGPRPSFDKNKNSRIEVHIYGEFNELYGSQLRFVCQEFIRGSQEFDGLDSLKKQINSDVQSWAKTTI